MNTRVKVITKRLMVIILSLTLIAGIPLSVGMAGGYDNAYAQEAVTGDEPAADDQESVIDEINNSEENVVIEEADVQEPAVTNEDKAAETKTMKGAASKKLANYGNWSLSDDNVTLTYSNREDSVYVYDMTAEDSIQVKSNDPSIVTASISENEISLERQGKGTTTVKVFNTNTNKQEFITVTCSTPNWTYNGKQIDGSTITIPSGTKYVELKFNGDIDDSSIYDSESTNYSVVEPEKYSGDLTLWRRGAGSATVKVELNDENTTLSFTVNCPRDAFKLSRNTVYYSGSDGNCTTYVYNTNNDSYIKSAVSSNKKVASASVVSKEVKIVAYRAGRSIVTVRDNYNRVQKITVNVYKSWVNKNLWLASYCLIPYSSKKVKLISKPGAKVLFKIKGKKYKRTIPRRGYTYVNLKKHYKLNTKFFVKFTYNGGVTKWKGKVFSDTNLWFRIYRYEKKCEVEVYNVTKGDIVYLKAGGKTYKKKIKRDAKKKTFVFKLKKYGGDIYHVKFIVKNKYKQTLYTWDQDLWRTYYRTIIYL